MVHRLMLLWSRSSVIKYAFTSFSNDDEDDDDDDEDDETLADLLVAAEMDAACGDDDDEVCIGYHPVLEAVALLAPSASMTSSVISCRESLGLACFAFLLSRHHQQQRGGITLSRLQCARSGRILVVVSMCGSNEKISLQTRLAVIAPFGRQWFPNR